MPNKMFGGFADEFDTGFERNQPVQSGVQAVKQGVQTVVKQAVQQIKPTTSDLQLIGGNTPSDEEQGVDAQGNPVQKPQQNTPQAAHGAAPSNTKPQPTPAQQKQHEEIKKFDEEYGDQFKLPQELKREEERQKQKLEQRNQLEEEEIQKAQAEKKKMPELEATSSKRTGMPAIRAKKASMPMRRAPIAVERERTKAESKVGSG